MMKPPLKPLEQTRKQFSLLVIAIGMSTFFVPLVTLNPAVMNRTQLSALDIAVNIYHRRLPVPKGSFDESLLEIALIYVLLPFALMALCLSGPPKALKVISGVGSILGSLAKFWRFGFLNTFGWEYWGPGHLR